MTILQSIEQFDPKYLQKLEDLMCQASPLLPQAEVALIGYLLVGTPFTSPTFDQCVGAVVQAIEVVQSYEVSYHEIDDDDQEKEVPCKTIRWDREAIVKDRFRYLLSLDKKILPA